jgi:protein-S-isoprenylcysteine O-methyltransferase
MGASADSPTSLPDDAATRMNQPYHRWTTSSSQTPSPSSADLEFERRQIHSNGHRSEQRHQAASYNPSLKPYFPGEPKSLSGIALRAFCLGLAGAGSVAAMTAILLLTESPIWRVPFFLLALSAFHFLEFWSTAERNTLVASIDSFLLTANWPSYAIAHSTAFLECFIVCYFFPDRSWAPFGSGPVIAAVGLLAVLLGQYVRSAAMLHAGASFNHQVQTKKADSHLLVTDGIYSWIRHPSYFGFFYWGLGTQMVMGNTFCFCAYGWVLWMFFNSRIRHEEDRLVDFFQEEYEDYRNRVGTRMPFIR